LARFEFKSGTVSFCFSFIFVSFEESHFKAKELALDKREWKLPIHVPKPLSLIPSFLLSSVKVFFLAHFRFLFWLSVLLSFLLLSNWFLFLSSFVFPLLF
jgi:hypothetical protein